MIHPFLTSTDTNLAQRLIRVIRDVPDFPKAGIVFKDITPVLQTPDLFKAIIEHWSQQLAGQPVDAIVGIESRGFLFGAPLAVAMGLPFAPVRKRGKLPHQVVQQAYDLEYGTDCIEMHADALHPNDRVVLVDDLLATGGTAWAASQLIAKLGATILTTLFVVELAFLNGRSTYPGPVDSLVVIS